jgi:hypothetical protein
MSSAIFDPGYNISNDVGDVKGTFKLIFVTLGAAFRQRTRTGWFERVPILLR